MKLPDLPSPRAPGLQAVDTSAVDRIAQNTRAQLQAVNYVADSLKNEYSSFVAAKDRADRAEARTRLKLYEVQQEERYSALAKEWNELELDRPVADFSEAWTESEDSAYQQLTGDVPPDVFRYMQDDLEVLRGRAGIQAQTFATEQATIRTIHQTNIAINATSNQIQDDPDIYESRVQESDDWIADALGNMSAEARGKYQTDMWNDYTVSYVTGLVNDGKLDEALNFLDNDDRADIRLYDKKALRNSVFAAATAEAEHSMVMANYLFDEVMSDIARTGQSDRAGELMAARARVSPRTLSQREQLQVLDEKIRDMADIAPVAQARPYMDSMTTEELAGYVGNLRDAANDPSSSKAQRQFADAVVTEGEKILAARQRDPTGYINQQSAVAGATFDRLTQAFAGALSGKVEAKEVAGLYQSYKGIKNQELRNRGIDPFSTGGDKLPKDSQLFQMVDTWLKDSPGGTELWNRAQTINGVFGDDAGDFYRESSNPIMMAVAGANNKEEAELIYKGWNIVSKVPQGNFTNAATNYLYGVPLGPLRQQILDEAYARYKLKHDQNDRERSTVNDDLVREAVWEATGILDSGSYGPNTRAVASYQRDGKFVEGRQLREQMRLLTQQDDDWSAYVPKRQEGVDYRPHLAVLGGSQAIVNKGKMAGKLTLVNYAGSQYQIVMVNGGNNGVDGILLDGNGQPLIIDMAKVPLRSPTWDEARRRSVEEGGEAVRTALTEGMQFP